MKALTLALVGLSGAASAQAIEPAALARLDAHAATFVALQLPAAAIACDVVLPLGDTEHTLRLWPHEVRSRDFRLIAVDGNGVQRLQPTPPSVTMRGAVLGSADGVVAGSLIDGGFEGLIRLDQALFGVQPTPELGAGMHAIYATDELLPLDAHCGTDAPASTVSQFVDRVRQAASSSLTFTTELAVDCDFEFYQQNGSSTSSTQNDVTGVINAMDAIFTSQTDLAHVITTILVRTSSNDPYSAFAPSNLLTQFQLHWANNQQAIQRDAAHLFTGKNLSGSVIGIANIAAVCSGAGYALSQSRFSGNFSRRVALTAHEIGHTLSGLHCNSSSNCRIMCSSISGCGPISSFGPTAITQITNFRNQASCFDVSSPPIVNSVSPDVEALDGDAIVVTGCHFSTLSSVTVAGVTIPKGSPRVTVLNDSLLEVVPETIPALGSIDLVVTGPGGDSPAVPVSVVPTDPARLLVGNDSFGAFPVQVAWGANPGSTSYVYFTLNDPATTTFMGTVLLANPIYSGIALPLDAAGLAAFQFLVPPFILFQQTLYLQIVFIGGGSFLGATPAVSTYFQI